MSKNEGKFFWIDVYDGEDHIGRLGTSDEDGEHQVGFDETISVVAWYELEDAMAVAKELTEKEGPYTYRANGGNANVAGNILDYLTEEEYQEMIAGRDVPEEKLAALHNMMREYEEKKERERSGENEFPPDGHPLYTINMVNNERGVGVNPHFNTPTNMLFPIVISSLRIFKTFFEENPESVSQIGNGEVMACEVIELVQDIEQLLRELIRGDNLSN